MIVSEINVKLTVLGYWGVGKTSLVNSYIGKDFPNMYIPTIGSNIVRKEYKLKENYIRVNIWDIGGHRSFNPLNPVFFSNLDVAFLVFDLSSPKDTLTEIKQTYLNNLKGNSPDCITFLIGNKSDLVKPEDSEVLLNNIRQFDVNEYPLFFISAKTMSNVSEVFELIIYEFLKKWERDNRSEQFVGISKEFLNYIKKDENELTSIIVNLEDITSSTLEKKITPKIVKKVVSELEDETLLGEIVSEAVSSQDSSLNIELLKSSIIEAFNNNLGVVEDLILNLKNSPIDSLMNNIDKTTKELEYLKDDFELKLENMLNLDKKENQEDKQEKD